MDEILKLDEVAKLLVKKEKSILDLIKKDQIRGKTVFNEIRIHKRNVEKYLDKKLPGTRKTFNEILTTEEAADYLRINKESILSLAKEGKSKGKKLNKSWRFHKDEVDEFVG